MAGRSARKEVLGLGNYFGPKNPGRSAGRRLVGRASREPQLPGEGGLAETIDDLRRASRAKREDEGRSRRRLRASAPTESPSSEPMPSPKLAAMVWARVRAALIALVLAVGLLDGLAIPEGRSAERLSPGLKRAAELSSRVRASLLLPFQGLRQALLFNQRWTLFGGAQEERHRLWIEGRRGRRQWTTLYRAQDPEHAWFAGGVEYRRVRAAWNVGRKGRRASYDAFTAWISERALGERPDLSAVRVRLEEGEVLPRGGGFRPTNRFVLKTVHGRGEKKQ